jgi:transglutaminase-like putative cysteine protease
MKLTQLKSIVLVSIPFVGLMPLRAAETMGQQVVSPAYMQPAGSRKFAIEYVGKVSGIPEGTKRLRVWMPAPEDSTVQSIRDLKFSSEATLRTEPKYGNTIAYCEIDSPKPTHEITMRFTCERKEILMDLAQLHSDGAPDPASKAFLNPDKLVLVDDTIRTMAAEVTAGKSTTLEKARAIYDYVLGRMTYDKSHAGWGLGSTKHACDVGKGNCTDFHALFNSLCRAQGIASGFEIGLYLPYEKNSKEALGGYHCWAFFQVPGKSWVPVDCSEADRFPERKEYFFGAHTPNRVTLSTGRDIILDPRQQGEPLNYFLDPYAEADGEPVKTGKSWSFRDL